MSNRTDIEDLENKKEVIIDNRLYVGRFDDEEDVYGAKCEKLKQELFELLPIETVPIKSGSDACVGNGRDWVFSFVVGIINGAYSATIVCGGTQGYFKGDTLKDVVDQLLEFYDSKIRHLKMEIPGRVSAAN